MQVAPRARALVVVASTVDTPVVGDVIGRDDELRAVAGFLDAVSAGLSVLVVRGEAGIGKTTVWSEAVCRAADRGFRVLRAQTASAETSLTLTTLADLVESVGDLDRFTLPPPQRLALDAALLRVQPTSATLQPRLLGVATRTLLERVAEEQPALIAIDDAQWMDAASAATLAFALRRLRNAPIGVLLAQRTGIELPLVPGAVAGPDRVTVVDIGPLTVAALHHLIKARSGSPPARSTLVRIHETSGGSPFFALEILRLLDDVGVPPPGEPLPVPPDVRALVADRIWRLPATTIESLLIVAMLGRAPRSLVEAALGRSVADDLAIASGEDIARLDSDAILFVHPLFAAAVQAATGAADRRRAHRRIADAVASEEERARHGALGADGPSARHAEALEAAAAHANGRGAAASAVDLMDLAISMTPREDRDATEDRMIQLARYAYRAGDIHRAEQMLLQAIDSVDRATRSRARLALAGIRYETDAPASAIELATTALEEAAGRPELLAQAHATLAAVDWEDLSRGAPHVAEAVRLLATVEDPDPVVMGLVLLEQCGADVAAGRALDPGLVERALALERRAAPAAVSDRFSASLGTWLKALDDFDGARYWIEQTCQTAIDEGDEGSLPYALSHLPQLELWSGHWQAADERAREHFDLAAELGLESQRRQALYNLALVHAHQGRVPEARAEISEALEAAAGDGDLWTQTIVVPVLGFLELSLGNLPEAVRHLVLGSELRDQVGQVSPRRHDEDLVESLVGVGDVPRATAALEAMEARAEQFGRHSALANAARSRALVAAASGDLDAAVAAIDRAFTEHDLATILFDRARTLLVFGQIRRRRRERGAAKVAFESALAIFEELGARLWADRTRDELARVGLRRSPGTGLTENERRVAELTASGMTNREVAAALFLSPKTVEANLSRAYGKLGVASRAELGALLARPATGDPTVQPEGIP
jgi:DNA-binding CsgD family transcriptional regulator